jgi:exopolyphosphatase/guanosine-5'-triphosphate,3'-diphosphate pyrophosphatase
LITSLQLAAIDLGSNSFRLEIGRADGGQIYVLDSLRSNVRLAAGLTQDKRLTSEAMERGLEAIGQFAQRLSGFDETRVRAVGTNTLRVAKNAPEFIARAEKLLGYPIEVIAGREEARLIFSGVAHSVPTPYGKRLVVDIGGGSTEFSVGTGFEPELMESLYMGSINYTLDHFPGGFIDDFTLKQAELAARREVQVIAADVMISGWHTAIASSGTARAISRILGENRGADTASGTIDVDGLRWLRKMMLTGGKIEALKMAGLKSDRALNLPGGFAILSAVFSELGITSMQVSDNSLRLGVLYDLLSRIKEPNGPHDKRQSTVTQFEERYHVDRAQAKRIINLAMMLAAHLKPVFREKYFEAIRFIEWAARLHEAGLTIAHNGYHKHSAYIIGNADMPGFSKAEQQRLAFLILGHAGKLPKLTRQMTEAPKSEWLAVACLRLAALFCRSRQDLELPDLRLALNGNRLVLDLDAGWLRQHPLTEYSLTQEIKHWQGLGEARPFSFELLQAETIAA